MLKLSGGDHPSTACEAKSMRECPLDTMWLSSSTTTSHAPSIRPLVVSIPVLWDPPVCPAPGRERSQRNLPSLFSLTTQNINDNIYTQYLQCCVILKSYLSPSKLLPAVCHGALRVFPKHESDHVTLLLSPSHPGDTTANAKLAIQGCQSPGFLGATSLPSSNQVEIWPFLP